MSPTLWAPVGACLALAAVVLARRRRAARLLPLADGGSFGRPARRSRILWTLLAGTLIVLMLAFAARARTSSPGAKLLAPGENAVIALDLSSSTRSSSRQIANALLALTQHGRRQLGLVVFSDTAYEALPPQMPVEGLRGWLRLFVEDPVRSYPWTPSFSSGTWISSGLKLARLALREAHVDNPHVILVSDLVDAAPDIAPLETVVAQYQREGIDLRVIAVPTERGARNVASAFTTPNVTFIEHGASATFQPAELQQPPSRTPMLVVLVAILGVVAAAYELGFHPLTWRTQT